MDIDKFVLSGADGNVADGAASEEVVLAAPAVPAELSPVSGGRRRRRSISPDLFESADLLLLSADLESEGRRS